MRAWEKWALGILLWGATCSACAGTHRIALTPRPDTRIIAGFAFDSLAMEQAIDLYRAAYPKEAALCLYGAIQDTMIGPQTVAIARIHHVALATADSTSQFNVFFPASPRSGCDGAGLLGHSHSHTSVPPNYPCTHSNDDANVIFTDPRLLFSIVFCQDGRREILFQDGRREPDYWARETEP